MPVDPAKANGTAHTQPERLDVSTSAPRKPREQEPSPRPAEDTVVLSPESQRLRGPAGAGETPPRDTLPAERLREVLDRIKTRYYDGDEIRDAIARRLLD